MPGPGVPGRGQQLPPPLGTFLRLFNAEAFWESHEALEGAWRENGSGFYKGLILLASAYVHVQRSNAHGVAAQLDKAMRELEPYRPVYLGLDVDAILAQASATRRLVPAVGGGAGAAAREGWRARIAFPKLEAAPERLRGDEAELRG